MKIFPEQPIKLLLFEIATFEDKPSVLRQPAEWA
jgi:hypothetical protein